MKIAFLTLAFVAALSSGCATVHSGHKTEHGGLIVSATFNDKMSSEHFELLEFTFENRSDQWISPKSPSLDFGDALNKSLIIPGGERIMLWAEAASNVENLREYNRQVLWGSLTVAGAVAAGISSQNDALRAGGLGAMAAGLTALTVSSIEKERDKVMRARIFPASHLYGGDFEVPPGLFIRRWVLVESRKNGTLASIRKVNLNYTLGNQGWQVPIILRAGKPE
jgi:hypothetical protein